MVNDKIELISCKFGDKDFELIRKIRYDVFVIEQQCPEEEEWDEYDESSVHLLLKVNDQPVGASRWRKISYLKYGGKIDTDAVKMERFAIYKDFRGKGYGSELVKQALKRVFQDTQELSIPLFLINAQQYVEKFYQSLGFETDQSIPIFYEANIPHVRMEIPTLKIKSLYFKE
ncbi:hypothetical protein DLAC_04892 [Tieghemostelium lacteum]|uniref:N-acetyltransferase domain-containing protein n=1 Tax=Tieghemostelium lacteum TaxID=361077 RepID=A0A151ZJ98_TIELA|nr:hypothetical protein DLAC_04892 [Tieghemostelium lacteum]|eukprot:KYQ93997.1 hypothetical protein DLAC_04892 [Tieghemostelium lacteum]